MGFPDNTTLIIFVIAFVINSISNIFIYRQNRVLKKMNDELKEDIMKINIRLTKNNNLIKQFNDKYSK